MIGIQTKFIGPANVRGSRIKAWRIDDKSANVTVGYDHAKSTDGNHNFAALALATKLGFDGQWLGASTLDGKVYVRLSNEIAVLINDSDYPMADFSIPKKG